MQVIKTFEYDNAATVSWCVRSLKVGFEHGLRDRLKYRAA